MSADSKTKLILHVDHLYKIKFFHHHDSGFCRANLDQLLIDKDAAEDIDKIIRGLIYLSQRNQILKTVCSDHFVVTFNRKPWKISQKITFKKNGKVLKVCPFSFEVILTCKRTLSTKQQDKNDSALERNTLTETFNTTERRETRSSLRRETRSSSQHETRSSSQHEIWYSSQHKTRSSSQREIWSPSQHKTRSSSQREIGSSSQRKTRSPSQYKTRSSPQHEIWSPSQHETRSSSQQNRKWSPSQRKTRSSSQREIGSSSQCKTRSFSQHEIWSPLQHDTRSFSQNEIGSSSQRKTRSSSQRVQRGSRQPSEEHSNPKIVNETRYSSGLRKQKRPLKRLPSREKKLRRMPRNSSWEEISSSSEDENNESEDEEKYSRRKTRRTKTKSSRDWMDKTRNVVVESPDTNFNTSGDIPLGVLTEISVKKRKRENESILEKTSTRKGNQTMVVGKSFHEALDTLEEEDGQVADILGTTLKRSGGNCTTAMDNVSVVDQSCKRKRGLNLYNGTDTPLMNLPSLDNSLVDPSSNITQQLNFKDSFLSPCVGSGKESRDGQKKDLYTSFTPLSRFNRNQKGGESHEEKKRVDFPVKDRYFIEREEIAEDVKLQEMSKADSSGTKPGVGRLSFGKSLWETLDTYFISPVKMMFERK